MKNYKFLVFLFFPIMLLSCNIGEQQKSDSGVTKASITDLKTDANGHTVEQNNIIKRTLRDNMPGSVKHLYIISAYTGDVLQYSTVRGKVTSGNKRLTPKTVDAAGGVSSTGVRGNYVSIGDNMYLTDEVLDDGGAYGESSNYMYWFDAQDNYQQYYPAGGTYVHISDRPLRVKKANLSLTMESIKEESDPPTMVSKPK
jgi:hypothetical protein